MVLAESPSRMPMAIEAPAHVGPGRRDRRRPLRASVRRTSSAFRCAARASGIEPILSVSSPTSSYARPAPAATGVRLARQQALQLAVERRPHRAGAGPQLLELVLLQQEVLADAGVVPPDRLDRQIEPLALSLVGRLEVGVGPVTLALAMPRSTLACRQLGVGPRLDRQHRRRPASATSTAAAAAVTPVRFRRQPTASARVQRLAPGRRPARRPSTARCPRPGPGRSVAVLGPRRHRLEADRLQRRVDRRVELPRRREFAPLHGAKHRRRRRRPRTAAGRSAGSRAWRRGCRRRCAGRAARGRRSACSGLM